MTYAHAAPAKSSSAATGRRRKRRTELLHRGSLDICHLCGRFSFLTIRAITFSQTLGTALGDWMADTGGLGYEGGALVFGAGLAILVAAYYWTNISRVTLFWAAFILTRPLGATVGDFLDKPVNHGGLHLSRLLASAVIAAFIIGCIILLPQKAGTHPAEPETA
jgi:uncharacterized membrane-anchored protein